MQPGRTHVKRQADVKEPRSWKNAERGGSISNSRSQDATQIGRRAGTAIMAKPQGGHEIRSRRSIRQ